MRYIDIPGTDLTPSAVCMGGVPLCVEGNDAAVFRLLDTYFDLGGNCVDSANVYGKWLVSGTNVCDRNLGKWMKDRGRREEVIVATKGGHPPLDALASPRLSKAEVAKDLEESLRALGTDHVDLFSLHRDDETSPVEVLIDYLNDFVDAGKVRYLGCSNWRPERIRAAQLYAANSGKQGVCVNQLVWSDVGAAHLLVFGEVPAYRRHELCRPGCCHPGKEVANERLLLPTPIEIPAEKGAESGHFKRIAAYPVPKDDRHCGRPISPAGRQPRRRLRPR